MDNFLFRRELYGSNSRRLRRASQVCRRDLEASMLKRLGSTKTLEEHNGCVNTLRWNDDGTLLASGSDDRTVCIWDICGQKRTQHQTNHDGNIFGVEFVPYGEDRVVATCAGDHMIKLHDIEQNEELHSFNADGRVKRLATAQDEPYLFWSAGEDGFVREHDVRANDARIIIRAPHGRYVKTMAVCQGRTEMVAVGLGVYYVPVYDRRMTSEGKAKVMLRCGPADCTTRSPRSQCLYSTHVAFDYPGRELIANQSGGMAGGSVFVYNLTDSTDPTPTVQKLARILDGSIEAPKKEGPIELDPQLIALKNEAKLLLDTPGKNFGKVIRLYTECLSGNFQMSSEQRSILYGNRSITYLLNRQQGDYYAALRDSIESLTLNPNYSKSYWRMMKALVELRQFKLAEECVDLFKKRFPASPDLHTLEKVLNEANAKKEDNQDGYEDLRSVTQPMQDYEARFTGHRNNQTDIKEANFFGSHNQYIISGSDDGCLFIWDRSSGLIKALFSADEDICNIAQPHPDKFLIATSGIEHSIRFWEPLPEGEEEQRRRKVEDLVQTSPWEHFMYLQALIHARTADPEEEMESDED